MWSTYLRCTQFLITIQQIQNIQFLLKAYTLVSGILLTDNVGVKYGKRASRVQVCSNIMLSYAEHESFVKSISDNHS